MVRDWFGIVAGLAVIECGLLLPLFNLFGMGIYMLCCIVTVANSLSLFGIEIARGKPFSDRIRGLWLIGYVMMVGYFVLTLTIYAMD